MTANRVRSACLAEVATIDVVANTGAVPRRSPSRSLTALRSRPEVPALAAVASGLNLWGLSVNGWANTFYAAAAHSMAHSWHDFLFASLDRAGLMTVDKPPLSLWVQALSARIFGFGPLSLLVPQALMGTAATVLVYDLVRRGFGRRAGIVAGLAFATTPIQVAMARHNNPDELLVLCCVAALWLAARALEDGRTRWLVACGAMVGLGVEAKMGAALMVVPGVAAAYAWVAPRGRATAIRQLAAGGAALTVIGLAWPVLVTLTPASDRPWISGTSDNSIWSLMLGYNGLGRIAGQAGATGGGGLFGAPGGVLRLLGPGIGDQAGWLLGFAVAAGLWIAVASRLRRSDARTGWLIAVGGTFGVGALVFTVARGIFHPYYVSLLAPVAAALVGAGVGQALRGGRRAARVLAPLVISAGAAGQLYVLGGLDGRLSWARPLVIVVAGAAAVALAFALTPRVRTTALGVGLAALLAAPATWAAETLGHATSSTFPAGGPEIAVAGPGAAGGPQAGVEFGGLGSAGGRWALGGLLGRAGVGPLPGGPPFGSIVPVPRGRTAVPRDSSFVAGAPSGRAGTRPPESVSGPFAGDTTGLGEALSYIRGHGGGTIGIQSQSGAAAWILTSDANVAGLGGFSGRETAVSARWLAMEVRDGRLGWLLGDWSAPSGTAGHDRHGSAIAIAQRAARRVRLADGVTLYDLRGRAAAILAAAGGS